MISWTISVPLSLLVAFVVVGTMVLYGLFVGWAIGAGRAWFDRRYPPPSSDVEEGT